MFSPRSMKNFSKDLFNRRNLRNAENTDDFDYNCAGFALGTFSWYCPSYSDDTWGLFYDWSMEYMTKLTEECVDIMLEDFSDLRVVQDMTQVQANEYAIAFRLSSDGDFHYVRQLYKDLWLHKPGVTSIQAMREYDVFNSDWNERYNGPIVLFAKKRL